MQMPNLENLTLSRPMNFVLVVIDFLCNLLNQFTIRYHHVSLSWSVTLKLYWNFNCFEFVKIFYYFQVLVIGDSIVRGIKWERFDIKTFPGITTEKLLKKVVL